MKLKKFDKPIYVTKPFLPPFTKFCHGLEEIWDTDILTNNGPILKRYLQELQSYFETKNICLFNNGTSALQIAIQGMGITGEVITTPFTFVATTHALYWNNIQPIFCDIEPQFFNIDPDKIEALITPKTSAILAVHVFGHPCNHEKLRTIATKHNIKLIYDAAHAFDVRINNLPIGLLGDLSMFSFHATKLYHSIEGGMLIFRDQQLQSTFDYLKNFGFKNETEVVMPGTNAKMNEFQALMGSLVLQYTSHNIVKRSHIYSLYKKYLKNIPGIRFCSDLSEDVKYNYAYMPIIINEYEFGINRDGLYNILRKNNVYARRYFYPLIPDFACYKSLERRDPLSVAGEISSQVLTLPIYPDLKDDAVAQICEIIINCTPQR